MLRAIRLMDWESRAEVQVRILEQFTNRARNDGLVLSHWARKEVAKPKPTTVDSTVSEDQQMETETTRPMDKDKDEEYRFAKYDIQVEVPTYTDEFYDAQLQDSEWTREETDHLVETVRDFGQKWSVVTDRYEPPSARTVDGVEKTQPRPRSMEQLKHRYYALSAKVLAHNTPISSMNANQYALYSLLQSFNPTTEATRKQLAEGHLYRTPVEVDEETILLGELQRIMINQAQLDAERREIRDRLEYPMPSSNPSSAQYSTSAALGALFQQLLQADRMKKDRKFKQMPEYSSANPSSSAQNAASAAQPSSSHRDSIASASGPGRKSGARESLTGGEARPLNPHAEQRYFITHHDRLSSGVTFASDKLIKPRMAKSVVQTERIAAVLSHLQIPEVIPLPTQKVVEEFDRLMTKVGVLLEMRKVADKEEAEIRVKNAEKSLRAERSGGKGSVKEERRTSMAETPEGGGGGGGGGGGAAAATATAAPAARGQSAGQKRSASVMSEGSEQQGNKRPKT